MANLLMSPDFWEDDDGVSPPGGWNGTEYTYSYSEAVSAYFVFTLTAEYQAGDRVTGAIEFSSRDTNNSFLLLTADNSAVVGSAEIVNGSASFDFEVTGTPAIRLILTTTSVSTSPSPYYALNVTVTPGAEPIEDCNFNCECEDPNPSRTMAQLQTELMVRCGFSAMTAHPPPGMMDLLKSFLQGAQRSLYRKYPVLRTERFFTWDLIEGVRLYDLDANRDICTKRLDPRMISWAGVSEDCDNWRPLACGIPPECYQNEDWTGIPSRYEIRQCIEVWPAPDSSPWKLRIKGDFGLEPFNADGDQCTIDDEAVFLFALARAKAHYGHPDASNYQRDAMDYIRDLTAGAHQTRRYIPGQPVVVPPPMPIWIPKVYP